MTTFFQSVWWGLLVGMFIGALGMGIWMLDHFRPMTKRERIAHLKRMAKQRLQWPGER